ncbi:uncharacterized protein [Parasteatoda tepidariorum]|uniref:uncharacterized protein n=1 Tax=Parasteatoda tepidariorum TaxID=114398 RepID=UPI001C728707|nr:monocarboxylate transporter 11 [Parasteatoda tepidariorum]
MEEKKCLQSESEKVIAVSKTIPPKKRVAKPDDGFAWVVAIAACAINLIMAGLGRMSGILFVAFIEIFGVDRKSASMPFSVRSSARNLFGPVVGILGQKYGSRKVIVVGGIVGTLSSAACFFAPDIVWITVLWGGVNGLGSALTVTLPQVVISQYFVKYRTTAVGIAFSGGCIGSFMFPVLLEYLLQNFGIQGTFLIMGAIIMHTIPAALILKKPPWLKSDAQKTEKSPNGSLSSMEKLEDGNGTVDVKSPTELVPKMDYLSTDRMSVTSVNECASKRSSLRTTSDDAFPDVSYLRQNSELVVKVVSLNISGDCLSISENENNDIMEEIISMCESRRNEQISLFRKNLKYFGDDVFDAREDFDSAKKSIEAQRKCKSCKLKPNVRLCRPHSDSDLSLLGNEAPENKTLNKLLQLQEIDKQKIAELFPGEEAKVIRILTEFRLLNLARPKTEEKVHKEQLPSEKQNVDIKVKTDEKETRANSFMDHIKTAFSLYANPLFLMVCLCRAVHFIAFIPAMTTVVDFTMDKGLHEDDGKYAIAAISMGDLLGRLCLGWITDRGYMTLPKYMMVFMVVQGFSTASLPMMNTKATIFANLALFGMLQGSLFVRHPVLIAKYMNNDEQSIAMGCVNFFSGLLGFGLPMYIGYFRDTIGSYDYIFYLNGMLGACVGILWAFEPFFVRCVNTKTIQKTSGV